MCFLFTCLCMPQLLIVFLCHLSPLSLPAAGVLATISAHLYGIILDLFFPPSLITLHGFLLSVCVCVCIAFYGEELIHRFLRHCV